MTHATPRRPAPRSAFTLVEALVALAVGFSALAALWSIVSSADDATSRGGARLDAVRAALQVEARLRDDLSRLFVDDDHPVATPDGPGPTLAFYVGEPHGSALQYGVAAVHHVTYRFDAEDGSLRRHLDDEPSVRLPGAYEAVAFDLQTPEGCPPTLAWLVTALSTAAASRPAATRRPSDRSVLHGSLPLRTLELRSSHPYWNCGILAAGQALEASKERLP